MSRPPSHADQRRPTSSISQALRRPLPISIPKPKHASTSRPASAASTLSSASTTRPLSSASTRSRPLSTSRFFPLARTLVSQFIESDDQDQEEVNRAVAHVVRAVDPSLGGGSGKFGGSTNDWGTVDRRIRGLAEKAQITSSQTYATALLRTYSKLKAHVRARSAQDDLDADIKLSNLPSHLQLLLTLTNPPTELTHYVASLSLHPPPTPPDPALTWAQIVKEEPFEGEHWVGVVEGLSSSSSEEDEEEDEEDEREEEDSLPSPPLSPPSSPSPSTPPSYPQHQPTPTHAYAHRTTLDALLARQYWQPDYRFDVKVGGFDVGEPSSLGPTFHNLQSTHPLGQLTREAYIPDHFAVRETLMALQGRQNLFLVWERTEVEAEVEAEDGTSGERRNRKRRKFAFVPSPTAPRLAHYTPLAQRSLFTRFAHTASVLERLRRFVRAVVTSHGSSSWNQNQHQTQTQTQNPTKRCRTLEAFAEAVGEEIRAFEGWCAGLEERLFAAGEQEGEGQVVSLLSLEKAVRDRVEGSFDALFGVVEKVMRRACPSSVREREEKGEQDEEELWTLVSRLPHTRGPSPSTLSTHLLSSLLTSAQLDDSQPLTTASLSGAFVGALHPLWDSSLRSWLHSGFPDATNGGEKLDEEFFVEDNELGILDPDFWVDGFGVKGGEGGKEGVPSFLEHVKEEVLSAGKSVGLLRALGVVEGVGLDDWRSFDALLFLDTGGEEVKTMSSPDALARLVYDALEPHCRKPRERLTGVLFEECGLWRHLHAMEDLYMMGRGDDVGHFVDTLFARMDTRPDWHDFHFLNSSFADTVSASNRARPHASQKWIDPSLVRLSYRSPHSQQPQPTRTVRTLDGLLVEYAVPFPLTYVFGPRALGVYNRVFVFLLQIRRAKSVLDRILVRGVGAEVGKRGELKVFYAMRSRLSWFVNTLLDFISTHVLHSQLLRFHDALRNMKSLDDVIRLHDEHLDKIQGRCLLQTHTSALHRAILSILDMSLYFNDCFVAFAGDTTHDVSRLSSLVTKRHRSRQQRRQRMNMIGFTQSLRDLEDSEDDSDSDFDENGPEPSFSAATASVSLAEEGFFVRLDKMSSELDGLVRFVRRGVESLAGGSGEAAQTYGVFAFALEDWDR